MAGLTPVGADVIGDAVIRIGTDDTGLESAFNKSFTKVDAFATAAGVAIAGIFAKGIQASVEFNKALGDLNTLGIGNIDKMGEGVRSLARRFDEDLQGAVTATYDTISAGLPEENALDFLEKSAIAAKAGVGELGDAVDLGTTFLNAFNLEATETTRIFDEVQAAIRLGKTNIAELGSSVGKVAPLFAAANVETSELLASLAQLTSQGISTRESVTGLRVAFQNILNPGAQAAKAAEKLGLEFSAAGLRSKGFIGTLNDIQKATKGDLDALKELFTSSEALVAVQALMVEEGGQLAEKLDQVANSTGESAAAFERWREANPTQVFTELKNTIGDIGIDIGEALTPALVALAEAFLPLAQVTADFVAGSPNFVRAVGLMTASVLAYEAVIIGRGLIAGTQALSVAVTAMGAASTTAAGAAGAGGLLGLASAGAAWAAVIGLGVGALAALTVETIKTNKAWNTQKETAVGLRESQLRLIQTAKQFGVEVDRTRLFSDDLNTSLKEEARVIQELRGETEKAATSFTKPVVLFNAMSEGAGGAATSMQELGTQLGLTSEQILASVEQTKTTTAELGAQLGLTSEQIANAIGENTATSVDQLNAQLEGTTLKSQEVASTFTEVQQAALSVVEPAKEFATLGEAAAADWTAGNAKIVALFKEDLGPEIELVEGAVDSLGEAWGAFTFDVKSGVESATDFVSNLAESILDLANSIESLKASAAREGALSGAGSDGDNAPGFASGGFIKTGQSGIVGEAGIERIVAEPGGVRVLSNQETKRSANGPMSVNIPVTIDASNADPSTLARLEESATAIGTGIRQNMTQVFRDFGLQPEF